MAELVVRHGTEPRTARPPPLRAGVTGDKQLSTAHVLRESLHIFSNTNDPQDPQFLVNSSDVVCVASNIESRSIPHVVEVW